MVTNDIPAWLHELYPFSRRRFSTAAGALNVVDEGTGDEVVLMVHGNPTWSFFYRKLIAALRGRFRCIAPDHLGCGLSDKPQDYHYTLANHIANLGQLVDSLDARRIHLVVHDWGGPIGLGTMLPRDSRLGKVVILNTAAFADTDVPWRIRTCRLPLVGEWLVRGCNGFALPATWMAVTKPLPSRVARGFLYPYNNWANRIATHRFVQDIPCGTGAPSDRAIAEVEQALPLLRQHPVAIVWGGADFCFNDHYFRRWQALLPGATATYLPSTGHYLMEDAGPEVLGAIQAHFE